VLNSNEQDTQRSV